MSVNKFKPCVYVIPEDDANRQMIVGFQGHDAVTNNELYVRAPANGWPKVLTVFEKEYLPLLRDSPNAHVVMLVDFDEVENRGDHIKKKIPEDVLSRVFVIGSKVDPETLRRELTMTFEEIGRELARDCHDEDFRTWRTPHLIHNDGELQRLKDVVRPILFQ